MNPAIIIQAARADGVKLALSPSGTIKVIGDGVAVNRWFTVIREHKAEIIDILKVGDGNAATSRWWRIHYPARDPVEVACCPEATYAEMLESYPDAIVVEPFTRIVREASIPMTTGEEAAILAWLALIEETDPVTIVEVIEQCHQDANARAYFIGQAAAELPKTDGKVSGGNVKLRCAPT